MLRPTLALFVLFATSLIAEDGLSLERARAELGRLRERVEGFQVVRLPDGPGRIELSAEQSVTVDMLRGVVLDDEPPMLAKPAKAYDRRMTDTFAPGEGPYVAEGIEPFRLRYFTNEFSYGGWHNWAMQDYAATHGFSVIYPYNHSPGDWTHMPKGTKWLRWGGFVNWHKWLKKHGIQDLRYDRLVDLDICECLASEGVFKPNEGYDQLMIDLEHRLLKPDALRKQPWYPGDADEVAKAAFEKRYYDGYALTYTAPVQAARQAGWSDISLYGWQPFARTFHGLGKVHIDPATDWAWNAFGRRIYESVDILNPSVYCFYWDPKNVAYTLANIDLNMALVRSMRPRKPMRPYYWTLLHGGGGGWRWWKGQPLPNEDVRAMTALCFFTGCDGLVLWNWAGTGNHHQPPALKAGTETDVMVGSPFKLAPREKAKEHTAFQRYDTLHVKSVSEEGMVVFQRIEKSNYRGNYGTTEDKATYEMSREELPALLRPRSEPVAALIEGLALVKPFEALLRYGEVKVDVSAQEQFEKGSPIVRRVKLGPYHVLATYDPGCVHGREARPIVLDDFDGTAGVMVTLPADNQVRIFVIEDAVE